MTIKEAKKIIFNQWQAFLEDNIDYGGVSEAYKMAMEALDQQELCDKNISDTRDVANEEAIEQLNVMKVFIGYDAENPLVKRMQSALDCAIKALEKTDNIEESNFSSEQYKADLQAAYDCGYNCGYADAMNDIAESEDA